MKNTFTVIGSFFFCLFLEWFARLIVMFYHQSVPQFYGVSALPGPGWTSIIVACIFLGAWLAGMLTVTITGSNSARILWLLAFLLISWRGFEYMISNETEPVWYYLIAVVSSSAGIFLAYFTQKRMTHAATV